MAKPTRDSEWRNDAVDYLRKYVPHKQRQEMDGTKLFLFWSEHRKTIPYFSGPGDPWQSFHSACSRYIGPTAYM